MREYLARHTANGDQVGCLLCPSMIQRSEKGTLADGMTMHLTRIHNIRDAKRLNEIVRRSVPTTQPPTRTGA